MKLVRVIKFGLRYFLNKMKNEIAFDRFTSEWKEMNMHNDTFPVIMFPISKVIIGNGTYGALDIRTFSDDKESIKIGNYCSIAKDVVFICGGRHQLDSLSTFPFKAALELGYDSKDSFSNGPIIIEDDVWLGTRVTVLDNVTIGRGAVIGAGCVVSKSVPPYSIVFGNPQRIVKKRFNDEIVEKLIHFDFEELNENEIRKNIDFFYKKIGDKKMLTF